MGARLASLAANPAWSGLTPRARLVFTFMCLTCYDKDHDDVPAGVYWGGHDLLVERIYGEVNSARANEVSRYIAQLVAAGAVERVEIARGRGRAAYRVTPQNLPGTTPHPGKIEP